MQVVSNRQEEKKPEPSALEALDGNVIVHQGGLGFLHSFALFYTFTISSICRAVASYRDYTTSQI